MQRQPAFVFSHTSVKRLRIVTSPPVVGPLVVRRPVMIADLPYTRTRVSLIVETPSLLSDIISSNICTRFRISDTRDRKSTRLNSSHTVISYAVFCLQEQKCDAC